MAASVVSTTFNCINTLLGVAFLSTPYALMCGGWMSLGLLFLLAAVTFYTGILIKRCMDSNPDISSYSDIGYAAFRNKGRVAISVCLNLELYLVATGFLILAGDNLDNMFPHFKIKFGIIAIGGRQLFVLLVSLLLLPTAWIEDLSTLSYLSATGVVAVFCILGSIMWSGLFEGIRFHHHGEIFRWRGLPTSLGLFALCFAGHPMFPTFYASMRTRRHFPLVLFICFLSSATINAVMAVIGYLMFGPDLQAQITLNLPGSHLSSKVATYTVLLNPLSKYGLLLRPIFDTIEGRFECLSTRRWYRLCMRSMVVGSTVVVALTIPFYGNLMSLVGAFTNVGASLLLPCVFFLKISGMHRKFCLESVIIGLIILMGSVVLVTGTYSSLSEIIKQMIHHS